jgi:hypothetical protein
LVAHIGEEYRLRVFENKVLSRIFGSKRDEVTGQWRRLRNEKLCALYFLPNIFGDQIKKTEMGRACSTYSVEEGCIQGFGGETWGKDSLLRPRRRWENNIKMGIREVGWSNSLDLTGSG